VGAWTPSRRDARRRAVEILYEADQRHTRADKLVEARLGRLAGSEQEAFVRAIVGGVAARRDEIDETLATHARGWSPDRMPAVDRAIARVGVWELLFAPDDATRGPSAVVLQQAADLAGELSTDKSPDFISGVLGRVAKVRDLY
jgi:N utilization substance protein B